MNNFNEALARLARNKDGSVGPVFGLMALPMFFVIGMSIDYSRAINVKGSVQNALDSAALAAMRSNSANPEAVGLAYFNANFSNGFATYPIVHFTKLNDGTVRATATVTVPTTAGQLMNVQTLQVETYSIVEPEHEVTSSTETTVSNWNLPCLHVMDQSGSHTFDMSNNSQVDAQYCIVKVRSNSNSAVRATGSNNVKFKRIKVKGGGSLDVGASTNKLNGGLDTDSQIVGNPYINAIRDVVQATSIGSCTSANTNKIWQGSVSPGTYCGTTEFKNATFATGLYVIKSSSGNKVGRLRITGSADGSAGVTFYLADNKSQIETYSPNNGSVFKAPTTGTTRGILFFEDSNRGNGWNLDMIVSKANDWTGLVYLPSANVKMDLDDWKLEVSMAVNQLWIDKINNLVWMPYSWTPFNATSPITLGDEDNDLTTTTSSSTSTTQIYLKE